MRVGGLAAPPIIAPTVGTRPRDCSGTPPLPPPQKKLKKTALRLKRRLIGAERQSAKDAARTLRSHFVGDAGFRKTHELSKRCMRAARAAGQRQDQTRDRGIPVSTSGFPRPPAPEYRPNASPSASACVGLKPMGKNYANRIPTTFATAPLRIAISSMLSPAVKAYRRRAFTSAFGSFSAKHSFWHSAKHKLKTGTAHLAIRPRLEIGDRKMLEKGISLY
jgi:hypothetical protein